jgi:hypothetical protein
MNKGNNARLVKANGHEASPAIAEAINTVSILNAEIGNDLKLLLLGRVTSPETLETKGDDGKKASFTEALIATTRNNFKSGDYDSIIPALEEKQKEWGNRGGQTIAANADEYIAWALGLSPLLDSEGKPLMAHGKNSDGMAVMFSLENHLKASIGFCLYSLTSLSNAAFKGTPEKINNKGKVKKSKPGLFDGDKGVDSTTIHGFAGEGWQFRAKVNYLVTDVGGASGSKIRKSLELINDAANKLNIDKIDELGSILRTLTGQNRDDKRFDFDPSLVANLIFARFCGLMYSGIGQWLRELREAKQKGNTIAAFAQSEELRLQMMIQDVARREAYSENHPDEGKETLPGSKVESSDTTATLPTATQKPITWRDRAHRRFTKQVWSRYPEMSKEEKDAIIERGIEQNVANADTGADFNVEATFEEYFSAASINEYLDAEDADAREAEIDEALKNESAEMAQVA